MVLGCTLLIVALILLWSIYRYYRRGDEPSYITRSMNRD